MNKLTIQLAVNITAIVGILVAIIYPHYWAAANILVSVSMFINSYNYYKLNKIDKFYIYLAAGVIFILNAMVM